MTRDEIKTLLLKVEIDAKDQEIKTLRRWIKRKKVQEYVLKARLQHTITYAELYVWPVGNN